MATDYILRGTAAQGMIRALAITAQNTVSTAQAAHGLSCAAAAALGRLLMGTQLMSVLLKDSQERISASIRCSGPIGSLTAVAKPDGTVKGFAKEPHPRNATVAETIGQGTLTVVRESPFIEPYVSQIPLVNSTISDDLTAFYIISEQIPTIVCLEILMQEETVSQAGGYLIQLMPGYDDSLLGKLEACLSNAGPFANLLLQGLGPEEILGKLLADLDFKAYETLPASFACDCSRELSEETLLSLGAAELQSMAATEETMEITCDYCGKRYCFTSDELQSLVAEIQ